MVPQEGGLAVDDSDAEVPIRPAGVVAEVGRDTGLAAAGEFADQLQPHVFGQHVAHGVEILVQLIPVIWANHFLQPAELTAG